MRIAFLTNRTTSVNLPVLKRLATSSEIDLAHVYFYDTISETRQSLLTIIRQLGLRSFSKKLFQALSYKLRTAVERALRGRAVASKFSHEFAIASGLSCSIVTDMNQSQTIEHLRTLGIDILVVCVCKNILKREVLELPRVASINLHPSLLPKYRGPMPTFWMLFNGEDTTGITFHLMTPQIDDGDVVGQFSVPIGGKRTEQEIESQVFQVAATQIEAVLHEIIEGTSAPIPQDTAQASYYTFPTSNDRCQLREKLRAAVT